MPDPIFDSALLSMCMTWRHDFGLLDRKEQMAIKRELLGLYEHHVKPAIDRASSAESSLAAMRQRVEEVEGVLRLLRHELRELLGDTAEKMNDKAWSRLRRQIEMADYVLAQVANAADTVLSSPPTDASTMGSDQPADPYSGELGNINLRNLAARMHAALGLLKRQGCYHPAMDSMREEGFRHGLNIGDRESEDHIGDATKMVGEKCHPYGYCPICGAPGVMRERRPNGDDRCANGHTYPSKDAVMEQKP